MTYPLRHGGWTVYFPYTFAWQFRRRLRHEPDLQFLFEWRHHHRGRGVPSNCPPDIVLAAGKITGELELHLQLGREYREQLRADSSAGLLASFNADQLWAGGVSHSSGRDIGVTHVTYVDRQRAIRFDRYDEIDVLPHTLFHIHQLVYPDRQFCFCELLFMHFVEPATCPYCGVRKQLRHFRPLAGPPPQRTDGVLDLITSGLGPLVPRWISLESRRRERDG